MYMYRYYLAQICSPKYYFSHIVLQRRSRTHSHNQTFSHYLKIRLHTHSNQLSYQHTYTQINKQTNTHSRFYYFYTT